MSTPAVSVIIPTYNRAEFVIQSVESVFRQTFADFELILVDDGSSDETKAALEPYRDRLYYLVQSNRGVSSARNLGLKKAQGEWLAFLDSDDLWLPEKLERQMGFLYSHSEVLICQTGELWIRNGRRVNPRKKHQKFSGDIFAPSLKLCLVSPSAVMIRKDLFQKIGPFDESLPACEDYDLWLRISAHYPIYLIDQPLVIKRGGHADQLSRTTPSLDRLRIQALIKLVHAGELTAAQTGLVLQELESKCRIYGQGCIKRGKNEEGQYYLGLPGLIASGLEKAVPI